MMLAAFELFFFETFFLSGYASPHVPSPYLALLCVFTLNVDGIVHYVLGAIPRAPHSTPISLKSVSRSTSSGFF